MAYSFGPDNATSAQLKKTATVLACCPLVAPLLSVLRVLTLNPRTMPPVRTAMEARRLMEDARHRYLPTVQDGKVLCIVPHLNFKGVELDRLDEETGLWERICKPATCGRF